ncbi:hypothetical protein JVU11DRAFT_11411 [Chiua virens]|nr:hypothetical protein JVU11DRAFT_11411 [Chiua virens]
MKSLVCHRISFSLESFFTFILFLPFTQSVVFRKGDTVKVNNATHHSNQHHELSAMDYWYATVRHIYAPSLDGFPPVVYLDLQWFYRRSDVLAIGSSGDATILAAAMLDMELVDSTPPPSSIIDVSIDGPPMSTSNARVMISSTFSTLCQKCNECICSSCPRPLYDPRFEQRYCFRCQGWIHLDCIDVERTISASTILSRMLYDPRIPKNLIEYNLYPTVRGGPHPITGNGTSTNLARSILQQSSNFELIADDWDSDIPFENIWTDNVQIRFFTCP